jgi:uncharacterized membrane protein (UPF0127 family)
MRVSRSLLGRPTLLLAASALTLAGATCRRPSGDDAPPQGDRTAREAGVPPLATGEVVVRTTAGDEVRVQVEFAVTVEQRRVGLMWRERLAADAGMLFVFPPPARHESFWMRNTLIPLDMIFIDAERRVLGVVERAQPVTESPRQVAGDSLYVLEVNGGFAREHGIGPGARIEIVGLDPAATP